MADRGMEGGGPEANSQRGLAPVVPSSSLELCEASPFHVPDRRRDGGDLSSVKRQRSRWPGYARSITCPLLPPPSRIVETG